MTTLNNALLARGLARSDGLAQLNIQATSSFFSGDNAKIQRLGDRVFIGAACAQDGAAVPAQRTWVGLEANGLMTYLDTRSTMFNISTIGGVTHAGATRVSDNPAGLSNASIVYAALAKNDLLSSTASERRSTWGLYGIAVRSADNGAEIAGAAQFGEVHIANFGGVIDVNPYSSAGMTSGVTYGFSIGSGGEYAEAGLAVNSASAALNIFSSNGVKFRKGIKFTSNCIDGNDGTTGTGVAMAFAKGHEQVWYYSGSEDSKGFTIRSDCNDITYAMKLVGSTTGLRVYDQYENTVVRFLPDTTITTAGAGNNSLLFRNFKSTTGNPAVQGTGSDTNVGVDLVGQNRAQFNIYGYSKVRLMARFADVGALTTAASNILIFNTTDAGASPYVKAGGSDTNSSVAVEGKGTGGFIARDGAAAIKFQMNTTGIGFFNTTPVAKQTISAALSTGGAETNTNIATAINAIRTALINYGLAISA
jgi:hypothetical protein